MNLPPTTIRHTWAALGGALALLLGLQFALAAVVGARPAALLPGGLPQEAYIKASNTNQARMYGDHEGEYFGDSVAIDGDTMVIGAPRESSGGTGVNGPQQGTGAPWSGAAY